MELPPEATEILTSLLHGIEAALDDNLIGFYLRGSLATGDFDPITSDIDFLAVTERPVSEAEFNTLSTLHKHLSALPHRYGHELEGTYIDRHSVRQFRGGEKYPTIGRGEALEWYRHGSNWVLERWMIREQGIILLGPDPKTLIDPLSPDQVSEAVRFRLHEWAESVTGEDDPDWLLYRGQQAYVVETMCRALYTLAVGKLASKPQSVKWAFAALPEPYRSTIERSQKWRYDKTADPSIVPEVRSFVLWAAETATGNIQV